jgi:hypothetical protein
MIRLSLVGRNAISVLADFDRAGVAYEVLRPPPGVIMNSGELVDLAKFAKDHAGWAVAAATVLAAWLSAKSTRKIMVTLKDNTIVHTEGLSVDEFAKVLERAKETMVMESGHTPLKAVSEEETKK